MFGAPHGAPDTAPELQGALIVARLEHEENALVAMLVGCDENVMYVMALQLLKARFPTVVMPLGNTMYGIELQPLNVFCASAVTPEGTALTVIKEQFSKALSPMLVRLSGRLLKVAL